MKHRHNPRQPKRSSNRLATAAAVLLAVAGTAGCPDKGTTTAKAPAPAPQPRSAVTSTVTGTAAQAKAEEKPAAAIYSYNPAGRRDPFTPIIIKEEKKVQAGTTPPLERYPVNEFKLAGIVWGGLGYHAMLEGPDGKGYFIRVGTKIGPNQGVVKKITQNTMHIEEKYKDPAGEVNRKEIIIELRKKQEGMP